MMISELPGDLLEEILFRVPATSLKQLGSTCKRWNGLFNDRRFTRKHFERATKQFLFLLLKEYRVCFMSINLHRVPSLELIGEPTPIHPRSILYQMFCDVSYCDGLLLCVNKEYNNSRLVVWNPCTGQTRWININRHNEDSTYALGSYQDKISNDISYKILSHNGCYGDNKEYEIYEINSDSWRILDVLSNFSIREDLNCGVSFKGKNYWIATDEKEGQVDIFLLVSFDYTTERFERLCLPRQYRSPDDNVYLSLVREEKLSVLLQRDRTSKTEIWVTNKIGDETKVVSWSIVLAVDLGPEFFTWTSLSFWIDEEKKVLVCSDNLARKGKYLKMHIVGEDNRVRTEDLEIGSSSFSVWHNYVPSLIQIGGKRKKGE